MALFRDDSGKTEKPTPQRLSDARRKGQVALSRRFTTAASLLVVVILLSASGSLLIGPLREVLRRGLTVDEARSRLHGASAEAMIDELGAVAAIVTPAVVLFAGTGALVVLLAGYGQIGLRLSDQAIGFKPERLNPMQGLSKLFSANAVARTGFSAVELAVLLTVPCVVLSQEMGTFAALYDADDFATSVATVAAIVLRIALWITVILLLLGLGDVAWQRFQHTRQLMMSKQEIDDERKRSEGDPLVRQRQRSAAMKMARQRMLDAVPTADVVVTNPTHFAVALRYDRMRQAAPKVVAKGMDHLAARIRELAQHNGVPLTSDPPLARALYRACPVGTEIPERFYHAVAVLLSHVYRLKGMTA